MKKTSFLLLLLASVLCVSCEPHENIIITHDDEVVEESNALVVSLSAAIQTDNQKVCNDDDMHISLSDISALDVIDDAKYKDNSDYSLEMEYFVNGNSIGISSDRKNGFSLTYKVKSLNLGQHTITAKIKTGKHLTAKGEIKECKFTVVAPVKRVNVTLGYIGHVSKDLSEFVTPVLKYTDFNGEHTIQITSDMWKEDSFTLKDGEEIFTCDWSNEIKTRLVPAEAYNMTFGFIPKEGAKADVNKKYYIGNGFSINKYSYTYNTVIYIGNITNITLDIDITIGGEGASESKYIIDGTKMEEYVKKLCATPIDYEILLQEDGKLNIAPVEK